MDVLFAQGVRFHNGQELTSRDVQFTLERLKDGTANGWLMRGVERVETIGPRVLRVKLNRPNWMFDRFMCSAAASILPFGFAGMEEDSYWSHPLGTGPFRLVTWTSGRIEMAAFDAYFQGRPYLDGVDIVIMPEECSTEMDGIAKVHHSLDTMRMDRSTPEDTWQEIEKLCQGCTLLTWNVSREGVQQSEAFRRAVRMILHPGDMVAELGGERALPAFGSVLTRAVPTRWNRRVPIASGGRWKNRVITERSSALHATKNMGKTACGS